MCKIFRNVPVLCEALLENILTEPRSALPMLLVTGSINHATVNLSLIGLGSARITPLALCS